nr:hypothetical protein Q903MT_gene1789 [Picea sitchensis]
MKGVLSVEVEIPSLRVLIESEIPEAEWIKERFEQFNFIEEWRLKAMCHVQSYPRCIARAFAKKVRAIELQVGDLVLKEVRVNLPDPKGKFRLNWDGPFVVKRITPEYTLRLINMDGEELPEPINADQVKKYYA